MLLPTRGKYLCEIVERAEKTESGIWIASTVDGDKVDNVARCIGVGEAEKNKKGKTRKIIAQRGDIVHYKSAFFGQKFKYDGKKYISLVADDIIAVERSGCNGVHDGLEYMFKSGTCGHCGLQPETVIAPIGYVIVDLVHEDSIGSFYVPDSVKLNSGDFYGDVVCSGVQEVGPGDKLTFFRNEGYVFTTFRTRKKLISVQKRWCLAKEGK